MIKDVKSTSKLLSLALRHKPHVLGLELDEHGYTPVSSLLSGMASKGHYLTRSELDHVVETNDKKRFAYSEDGLKIRASQGHSVEVDLDLQPATPPDQLYHGTAAINLSSIREKGLLRGQRQHVHLSADRETASKVGARHGKAVVLVIDTYKMDQDEFLFYRSANGVWLTERVPAPYILP